MFDLFNISDTADFEFIQSQIGTDVYINQSATPTRVVITNTNLNSGYDDKKITSLSPIHRGDTIVYEGNKYMLISEINTERYNKFKGIIRRLPQTIIVNSSCRFIHVDCFITVGDLGVTSGKVITVADGSINVFTNNYYKDLGLEIGNRFFVDGQMFKITGIDTFSQKGIANLSCEKDLINSSTDDVANGIAGGLACPVDITTEPTSVVLGSTLQLVYTSTSNAPVTFTSSNTAIATVNATGLVTSHSVGSVTVTIANATNGRITDTVILAVEDVPVSKTIVLTSDTSPISEIKETRSKTMTANIYDGTTLITNGSEPVTWGLYEDDLVTPYNTVNMQITATTASTITLKCVKYARLYYVQLKCTLNSDPSIFIWQRIAIKSLY
ncbi:Ig-like domain-containing protein [Paenibacillus tritici]|uniref:Ig-like domain-containing protein n=1 Tax=Paenibacillus tritici TaxID=1873425 RepID=UPI001BAD6388|nr:Ig-like domain-containing protein [Paenibacillus tritici]QUL57358.1 Ig-like domain-containing protein [Paenibacillus tritici]